METTGVNDGTEVNYVTEVDETRGVAGSTTVLREVVRDDGESDTLVVSVELAEEEVTVTGMFEVVQGDNDVTDGQGEGFQDQTRNVIDVVTLSIIEDVVIGQVSQTIGLNLNDGETSTIPGEQTWVSSVRVTSGAGSHGTTCAQPYRWFEYGNQDLHVIVPGLRQ